MNSKVKGNIRPGEEQLGDGIVRPSADVTARHNIPFCRTYLRPKRANAGDPYAGLKYIDQVFVCTCSGTQMVPQRNLWLASRRTFGTGLLCRRTTQEKVGKRAMLVQGDELLFSAQLVHLRDAWLAAW